MRMRWKAAAMMLTVLAAVAGCGQDATAPDAAAVRPRFDVDIPISEWTDSVPGDTVFGGYYGSGHRADSGEGDGNDTTTTNP